MPEPQAQNPLTVPTPSGTQANPTVVTPARRAVEGGMRQDGVINRMREAQLERAKVAGRTAQQHVDMMQAATMAQVAAAVREDPTVQLKEIRPDAGSFQPGQAAKAFATQLVGKAPNPTPAETVAPVAAPVVQQTQPAMQPQVQAPVPSPVVSQVPAEEPKPTFANKQLEVSWNTIRESEKQVIAQRAQLQAELAAFKADQAKLQQPNQDLQNLQNGLKTNLAGTLRGMGYTAAQIAEVALSLNGTPVQQQQQFQQPQQPQFQQPARQAEPPQDIREMQAQIKQLTETATTLQNVIITNQYGAELAKPEFELLRTMPDAMDRAIAAWRDHHSATGRGLTLTEACGRAQEELVAAKRAEFDRLNSNPAWSKALGSSAQSHSGSQPEPAPTSVAPGASTEVTSLSANLAPGGPVPPVTVGPTQWLPPDQARRQTALDRARKAGETSFNR